MLSYTMGVSALLSTPARSCQRIHAHVWSALTKSETRTHTHTHIKYMSLQFPSVSIMRGEWEIFHSVSAYDYEDYILWWQPADISRRRAFPAFRCAKGGLRARDLFFGRIFGLWCWIVITIISNSKYSKTYVNIFVWYCRPMCSHRACAYSF